jgi:hypothetical protein
MTLSNIHPSPVELSLERSSPNPVWLQEVLTAITHPFLGGYCDSDQEIRDMEVAHTTRSEMGVAGELERDIVEDNSIEAQAEHYF